MVKPPGNSLEVFSARRATEKPHIATLLEMYLVLYIYQETPTCVKSTNETIGALKSLVSLFMWYPIPDEDIAECEKLIQFLLSTKALDNLRMSGDTAEVNFLLQPAFKSLRPPMRV